LTVAKPSASAPTHHEVAAPENAVESFAEALVGVWPSKPNGDAVDLVNHYAATLSETYKHDVAPARIADDLHRVQGLADQGIDAHLYRPGERGEQCRLVVHVATTPVSLSTMLPILHSLGVHVVDQFPHRIVRRDGVDTWLYDFGVAAPALTRLSDADAADVGAGFAAAAERIRQTIIAVWDGRAESDPFNALVLHADLTWQQANILRVYGRYLQQVAFPHGLERIASVLRDNACAARGLAELFAARLNPHAATQADDRHIEALRSMIDDAVSLEADRVLRALLDLVLATVRTNLYRQPTLGAPCSPAVAVKLQTGQLTFVPHPRPPFEVFVSSPRFEGVHLRFGHVARGGLRWSDRTDDFRTEILGLVKAQAVKNAVIIPVGAKGGFVVRTAIEPTGESSTDRQARHELGVDAYRSFIGALLDITDNVDTDGTVIAPAGVLRRDGDDPYFVVAADKGTATFSDLANAVSAEYGYWLGDAFASGGSIGYDHKAMGITAKGAWEAVKRHFGERGLNTATDTFTAVGIGDMSGDVFGNGMLLSPQLRLIAAFDHRHIFLDPDPGSTLALRERQRLFGLERSSWADYDSASISTGGGVYPRTAKSITLTDEVRRALGIDAGIDRMAPHDLIAAILRAPVDLLWNGGIGTYIKASSETHLDVGDKTNDAVRVDASDVRAAVIGEGGNLGVTARGRIEYAQRGGSINTDALDNSAGVDCSDHEVNIKILLAGLVSNETLCGAERDTLLRSMTGDIEAQVLANNIAQNAVLGSSRATAAERILIHGRQLRALESTHGLNRALEVLPDDAEIRRRAQAGQGMTSPELATLMAHTKLALKSELLASDLPDSEVFTARLRQYFPEQLQLRYPDAIGNHRLRREIVSTILTNEVVDVGGLTYVFRLAEDTGCDSTDAVRAFVAASAIFDVPALMAAIAATSPCAGAGDRMIAEVRRLLDRAGRWLLSHRPQPLAVGAQIARFGAAVAQLVPAVPTWLAGPDAAMVVERSAELVALGIDPSQARNISSLLDCFCALDIIEISDVENRAIDDVAPLYYALSAHLGIDHLLTAISALDDADRWDALAKLTLREDVYDAMRSLCRDVLTWTTSGESVQQMIGEWELANRSRLARARNMLAEVVQRNVYDVKTLTVATRQIRTMVGKPVDAAAASVSV
jgi:glutamate dehydrogenase